MKILFVAAEVAPFISVGGLSQVMSFLPKALLKAGHDVRVFTAKYGLIDGTGGNVQPKKKWPMKMVWEGLSVPVGPADAKAKAGEGKRFIVCNVKSARASENDPIVYFLENREYFELRANVYGYADDHVRFSLLSKGCLEWLLQVSQQKAEGKIAGEFWFPDIVHCNDWHTGYLLDMARNDPRYKELFHNVTLVYTVHNFRHQGNGVVDFRFVNEKDRDMLKTPLPSLFSPGLHAINVLARGIVHADVVNTVSRSHVEEVLTPEYGEGLDGLLKEHRKKLTGILNGLDVREFNPATDQLIRRRYTVRNLSVRAENKLALQREFGLPTRAEVPLLAISGRMDRQKGIELLMDSLPHLLANYEFQFVALGGGEDSYRNFFLDLSSKYPDRVGLHLLPNFRLPRKIFAGADILLMPSKFEPGGIVAMEAMRYGAVPLVRRTGGLNDIVIDYDPNTGFGNGFSFRDFDAWSLFGAVVQGLTVYWDHAQWKRLVRNCMRADFSWNHAAQEYVDLYHGAMGK